MNGKKAKIIRYKAQDYSSLKGTDLERSHLLLKKIYNNSTRQEKTKLF